jgi:amidase
LDPLSFDIDGSFKESKITDKQISNIKIGWLKDMNNSYQFENGIISMCVSKLKELEKHNILIESLQPKINSSKMWDSWTTLRAKSIFEDTESMNLKNIEEMTYQAIWEYKKGANIKDDDIEKAINQKNECIKEVDDVFKDYDFLILPSAQVFPFDKNVQFPKRINNFELDTYHRWIEVFIMSSLLDLPTITVPVGFNENGMPMGMQIIAKKFDDLKLLAFAKRYEEIFNYSKIKPKFSN